MLGSNGVEWGVIMKNRTPESSEEQGLDWQKPVEMQGEDGKHLEKKGEREGLFVSF